MGAGVEETKEFRQHPLGRYEGATRVGRTGEDVCDGKGRTGPEYLRWAMNDGIWSRRAGGATVSVSRLSGWRGGEADANDELDVPAAAPARPSAACQTTASIPLLLLLVRSPATSLARPARRRRRRQAHPPSARRWPRAQACPSSSCPRRRPRLRTCGTHSGESSLQPMSPPRRRSRSRRRASETRTGRA